MTQGSSLLATLGFESESLWDSPLLRFPAFPNSGAFGKSRPDVQSQRDCVLQPRVARNELPWVRRITATQPQRGCGQACVGGSSVPHIFLLPFDLVFFQQCTQFVLKTNIAMMWLLSGNILLHLFEIRLAHGKIRIASLPFEIG